MALQESIIQFKGRVGNLTFFKTKDGYAVRTKKGVDGNKVLTHPKYAATRNNMADFQRVMKSTSLFRAAFANDIKAVGDGKLGIRFSSLLHKLYRQDTVNLKGSLQLHPAATAALEGFEFNRAVALAMSLRVPFTSAISRSAGSLSVEVTAFSPARLIDRPEGATHFILTASAAELDFINGTQSSTSAQSQPISLLEEEQPALSLVNSIPGSTKPLLLSFGIRFIQIFNGRIYPVAASQHSGMRIVKVDTGVTV